MKNKMKVVMAYEFKKLVTSKGFIVATILGPFLIIGMMFISAFAGVNAASGSGKDVHIAIVGDNAAVPSVAGALMQSGWVVDLMNTTDGLNQAVFDGNLNGYCVTDSDYNFSYYSTDTGDMAVTSTLDAIVSECVVSAKLAEAGIDPLFVQQISTNSGIKTFKLSDKDELAEETNSGNDFMMKLLVPMCFGLLIYMSLLLYGQMIGRSVVVEKSSKIVDVLISSVKPSQLLFGKLIGVGLGGLVQYAVWMIFGLIGLKVTKSLEISLGLPFIDFVWLVAFFLFGFVLYGAIYAAIGAASEDEQHMGQLSGPVVIFLIIPIVFLTGITQNPNSILAVVLSEFPLTSPIIMLARLIQGPVPAWQLILCFALMIGCIALFIKMAGKIFRIGIMLSGKSFGFKDMKLWLTADKK